MKKIILIALLLIGFTDGYFCQVKKEVKHYSYAYQSGDKIFVCGDDFKKPEQIAKGYNPYISPDGKKLAFTEIKKDERYISLVDLNTKKKTRLPLQNNNFYGPVWSPDGKYIAMNVFSGKEWVIGIMDTNYNFSAITRDIVKGSSFSPSFTSDSKKLVVHDMDTIYIFSLGGDIISKIPVNKVVSECYISSSTRFIFSPDEKYIYFEADVEDEGIEFPSAIFEYDIEKNNTKRLTPAGQCCLRPFVQDNESVLFTSYSGNSKKPCIYKINPKTGKMNLLLKNADDITAELHLGGF